MKFKPKILNYDRKKELKWLGKFWIPKLFDGEHTLKINTLDEDNVVFIQKERFSGLLVPLLSKMLNDTKSGFEMMNINLKRESEKKMKKL
jgi:hypothetical protein